MDKLNSTLSSFTGGSGNQETSQQPTEQKSEGSSGGFLGGIGDKLNSAAGGGKESEKNEDYLDKGMQHSSSFVRRSYCFQRQELSLVLETNYYQVSTLFRRSSWVKV